MNGTKKLTHSILMCLLVGASLLCTSCSVHKKLVKSPTPATTSAPAPTTTPENATTTATPENTATIAAPENTTPTAQAGSEHPAATSTEPTKNTVSEQTTAPETTAMAVEEPTKATESTPSTSKQTPAYTSSGARTRKNKSVVPATPAQETATPTQETTTPVQETTTLTQETATPETTDLPENEVAEDISLLETLDETPSEVHPEGETGPASYRANTNTLNILNWSIIIILLLLLLVAIVIILIQRKKLKDAHEREDYLKSRLNSPAVMQAEVSTPQPEEPAKELINSNEEHDRLFGVAPLEQTEEAANEPEPTEVVPAEAIAAEITNPTAEEAETATKEQPVAVAESVVEPIVSEAAETNDNGAQEADNQAIAASNEKTIASQAMLKKLLNERVQMEQPFKTPNQIKAFMKSFDEAYPGYMNGIKQNHPEVTDADALVIAFMINELNIQQICVLLNSKPRTVWSRRLRMKTHLGLTQNDDLDQWVKESI